MTCDCQFAHGLEDSFVQEQLWSRDATGKMPCGGLKGRSSVGVHLLESGEEPARASAAQLQMSSSFTLSTCCWVQKGIAFLQACAGVV